jgi:tRNA-dihydrouridine synthase C
VHARTRVQLYRPPVAWDALALARQAVAMPVVANGDINTVADLQRCAAQSGCSAFMIGRGAMGRPWLFRQARGHDEPDFDPQRYRELLQEYVARLLLHGAPERAALGRLKQWLRLGAPAFAEVNALFQAIKQQPSLTQALELLAADSPPPPAPDRRPRRESASPGRDPALAPAP